PARAAAPGLWARFVGWVGGHRSQLLTGFVAAGAAAAITVVARPAHQRTVYVPTTVASNGNGGGTGVGVGSGTGTGSAGPVLVSARSTPTEVESLDVPDGTGSVFTIDDDDGETTVIWVTPDDVVEGL
ncbi:MAG TPA: hypothetical protein VHE35_08845, partial [Kofleriaceae bacterium]|nr:hypothetical protein [Kofleriaceae bacterium]